MENRTSNLTGLYEDTYYAQAGNIYSLYRLADGGYISGLLTNIKEGSFCQARKSLRLYATPDDLQTMDKVDKEMDDSIKETVNFPLIRRESK